MTTIFEKTIKNDDYFQRDHYHSHRKSQEYRIGPTSMNMYKKLLINYQKWACLVWKFLMDHVRTCVISPYRATPHHFLPELVRNRRKLSKNTFCTCPTIFVFLQNIDFQIVSNFIEHFGLYLTVFEKTQTPFISVSKFRTQWRAGQLPIFYMDLLREKNVK